VETRSTGVTVASATAGARWVWRWRRWTRWSLSPAILVVAAVTVGVDVASAWANVSLGALGRVGVSPGLVPAAALVALLGLGRLGLGADDRRAWGEVLVIFAAVLATATMSYGSGTGRWSEAVGLSVGALGEELVYRVAAVIVVGALVARLLGRDWRNTARWGVGPGVAGIVAASVVFSILPGHVAQMSDIAHALPFASLGLVLGYCVLRTGAVLPAACVHAMLNLATITALSSGATSTTWRSAFAGAALGCLLLGTIVAGLRLGLLQKRPTVVDLRVPSA